jgi:FAD/FMN-containing dehydrogenase/Fe-S oxidoreductase
MTSIAPLRPPSHANTYAEEARRVDAKALARALAHEIDGEVRFDDGSRALYATDGSNYRQVPLGVVVPKSRDDIRATVALCRKFGAPLLSRGGGTSLAGQCCNVAVVIDYSKYYNRVLEIDPAKRLVRVEPGIVLDAMRKETRKHGLTFGPDPATHDHCTIGGMLGNNSCGTHSVMAQHFGPGPRMADNTRRLTVLTYDGLEFEVGPTSDEEFAAIIAAGGRRAEIYQRMAALRDRAAEQIRTRYPQIPRRVSGYTLDALLPENGFNVAHALVGSESTCVAILEATLQLIEEPKARSLLMVGYDDVYAAARHAPAAMRHKPIGLEGIDDKLIGFMRKRHLHEKDLPYLPEGNGWLMIEFGGDSKAESDAKARALMAELGRGKGEREMRLFDDPAEEKKLWEIRESGLGATAFVPGMDDAWEGWEDAGVPPDRLADYLHDFRDLLTKHRYDTTLYGHFGQGCIHCRINFDFVTHDGIENYRAFTREAAHLVVRYGGSLSGEHGDGQSRGELLGIMYGDDLVGAFREFKAIWDPEWKMNPGKKVDPYHRTENLRLGTDYNPREPKTHFTYPEDKGSFARAALRCVGVGKCRRDEGGTMCPSYMATKEEAHSTRGRAHLLFEMLRGEVIGKDGGWKSEAVHDALDLCLACKGCKGDCPVNVDMATYKAEFLSHYYQGKLRPRAAYAFGLIHRWARLAALAPGIANFFIQTPGLSRIAKWIGGIAPERKIPAFAARTFRSWFLGQERPPSDRPRVILWADTFNNHFLPDTLRAGAEVLEKAGFDVIVPKAKLCCGRPLYDYGMLDTAKALLRDILSTLREEIRQGIPVVGLEPSCVAVFRDELLNLFPHDQDAVRLSKQTFTLAEFLIRRAPHFQPPPLRRKAIVQTHCHHLAVMRRDDDLELLKKLGIEAEPLQDGCCGMAGGFGYEAGEKYEVSIKAGEHKFLPKVRATPADTLILADGFSCREQIVQQTGRQPLHLAEVIALALRPPNSQPHQPHE